MKTVNSDMAHRAYFNRQITFNSASEITIFNCRFTNCNFIFAGQNIVKFDRCVFDYTLPDSSDNNKFKLINCDFLPQEDRQRKIEMKIEKTIIEFLKIDNEDLSADVSQFSNSTFTQSVIVGEWNSFTECEFTNATIATGGNHYFRCEFTDCEFSLSKENKFTDCRFYGASWFSGNVLFDNCNFAN